MKILSTQTGYTIKALAFEIVVGSSCRDNSFVILIIYPINIAVSSYETKMMVWHNTNNTLFIQIWRTDGRVVNAIISTDLFCLICTRFKEVVEHSPRIIVICYQYLSHTYFFERFS